MARLRFIKGTIIGRLGEFVGSRWKGINYIKTFTPPSNPKTEKQNSVRQVFKELSHFATALFKVGLLDLIPPAPRMTERNSVFKANGQMLTNKVFTPQSLQVAGANYTPVSSVSHNGIYTASDGELEGVTTIAWSSPTMKTRSTVHYIVYDRVSRIAYAAKFAGSNVSNSLGVDLPKTLVKTNLTILIFFTALEDDKKLISQTFTYAVA
jgi:hypothetical protein